MLVPEIAVLGRNGYFWVLADLTGCITDRSGGLALRLEFHNAGIWVT